MKWTNLAIMLALVAFSHTAAANRPGPVTQGIDGTSIAGVAQPQTKPSVDLAIRRPDAVTPKVWQKWLCELGVAPAGWGCSAK